MLNDSNMNSEKNARVIAFYLPQYHPIRENNEWWGEGFTEWTTVAKAKPLFRGHQQPRIPADLGFYDLRMAGIRNKQAEMAKKAGIEGFCYWHYWFGNGKRLLETPFNEVLTSGNPDYPFCLAWANHSWYKKTWDVKGSNVLLMEQLYPGEEDYILHFQTLLPAFKDKRYIKVDGKLLFVIFEPLDNPDMEAFINCWRKLAKQNGLNDFYFVARDADSRNKKNSLSKGFDAIYNDDLFNIHHRLNKLTKVLLLMQRKILKKPTVFSYKKAIKYMVTDDCRNNNVIPVIAPNWDHSPRSGNNAIILHNSKPELFKKVVNRALSVVENKPVEEKIIFIKSWNEWGEGNYLEPDLQFGKAYLNVLEETLINKK